jgi:hypothetical protein
MVPRAGREPPRAIPVAAGFFQNLGRSEASKVARMRRRLINLAVLLSFAAALTAGAFWVRSLRFDESQVGESLSFKRSDPRWWVVSRHGKLTLCRQNGRDWGEEFGDVNVLGFSFGGMRGPNGSLWNLSVPYWFVAGVTAAPPVWWTLRVCRRRRRGRAGLCPSCGYDLRASGGRCPECGTMPTGGAATASDGAAGYS